MQVLALEHPLVAPRAPRLAPRPQVEPGAAAEAAEAAERAEHHDGDSRAAERRGRYSYALYWVARNS